MDCPHSVLESLLKLICKVNRAGKKNVELQLLLKLGVYQVYT